MELIGFTFKTSQKEFEEWQIDNPNFKVHSVIPHVRELSLANDKKKYELGMSGTTEWGIFVTYLYKKEEQV